MKWSEQQEAIFKWFEGEHHRDARSLVIRARAGTGKTTTILEGINHAPETSIMLSAFNKNIATELQAKLKNPYAEAKTLHSLGYGIIRRFWNRANVDTKRTNNLAARVCGGSAPDQMINIVAKLAGKGKEMCPLAAKPENLFDLAEEFDCVPDHEWEEDGWDLQRVAKYALATMRESCNPDGTVDYADMLYLPIANRWVRGRYDLVVIDEAQDMNASQIILAQKSVKPGGRIAVVGDDRQAIYGFRGADSAVIDRLKTELHAVELGLTTTYRCPKHVVAIAQRIVPDYNAHEIAPDGIISSMTLEEAIKIAEPGDFILSRTNAPLVGACLKILRSNKRARIQGKDIGAGLNALVRKWKSRSLPEFLVRLANWEEREIHRAELSGSKNTETKIEKIQDQAETIRALSEGLSGLPELQARIESLFTDNGGPAIMCSSIHKAKGLESTSVFILASTLRSNQEPPCLCHHWAHPGQPCSKCECTGYRPDDDKHMEELNLEYVAVTRSKNHLIWITDQF